MELSKRIKNLIGNYLIKINMQMIAFINKILTAIQIKLFQEI
jgi:hypothetical protein